MESEKQNISLHVVGMAWMKMTAGVDRISLQIFERQILGD